MQATATKPETKTTDIKNVPRIQVSYDYGLFKLMGGNREIDYNHVKRLKKSMQAHPDLSPSNAIEVNEHYYIIDGQHRRMAWQELGMPVYFVVNEGGDARRYPYRKRHTEVMDTVRFCQELR